MKKLNILLSLILSILFILSIFPLTVFAENDVISIENEKDFLKLAKNSISDTYTLGKTYILKNDLDFTNIDFEPIGVFNGTFDGGNNQIKGIETKDASSVYGIFRKIGENGYVKNLFVEIVIKSGSIGENIGALCGENYGTIENVNVNTILKGIKRVGGIAGSNYGTIKTSSAIGNISGEHMTGGISGYNEGLISNCKSSCFVNKEYIEVTTYEISVVSYLPEQLAKLLLPEEIVGVTDIGGIAGYSSGWIYKCKNELDVGYYKTGSNVGGIVGRGTQFIVGCENKGNVYGKNDIGGIVGQLIPAANWNLAENKLNKISSDFEILHENINELLDYTDDYSNTFNTNIKDVTKQLDVVEKNLNSFLVDGEKWADSSITKVNNFSDRLSVVVSILNGASTEMEEFAKYTSFTMNDISLASKELALAIEYYADNRDAFTAITDDLAVTSEKLAGLTQKYAQIYQNGIDMLNAGKDIIEIQKEFYEALKTYVELVETIYNMYDGFYEFITSNNIFLSIATALMLNSIRTTLEDSYNKLENIMSLGIDSISLQLSTVLDINDTINSLIPLFNDFSRAINVASDGSEYLSEFFNYFSSATDNISVGFVHFKEALADVSTALAYLSKGTNLHFDYVTDYVSSSQKKFFDSLEVLNEKIDNLSNGFTDDKLTAKVRKVSDSLFDLSEDIVDTLNDLTKLQERKYIDNTNLTYDDYLSSTEINKDEKIDNNYAIIYECVNSGTVKGETNIGGICGIISLDVDNVESALNIEGLILSGSKFIISASIQKAENYSEVIASKGYAGGIVGKQIYGVILDSYSQSHITSSGDYAGGVCGYSESQITSSKSRSAISGLNYVGGIAGLCKNIDNNTSVCDISDGKEYVGSIAGNCTGIAEANVYGIYRNGGINGFDYSGKAEYDESVSFVEDNKLGKTITVTFIYNGIIEEKTIPYNTKLTDIPKVENNDENYWVWDNIPQDEITYDITITGSYQKPKTTISTGEKIPTILVEGKFYENNTLNVTDIEDEKFNLKSDYSFAKKIEVSNLEGTITVRARTEKNGKLYTIKDDKLVKTKYTTEGSYIVFEIENGDTIYYKASSVNVKLIVILSIVGLLATAAIVTLVILIVRNNKKKKQAEKDINKVDFND